MTPTREELAENRRRGREKSQQDRKATAAQDSMDRLLALAQADPEAARKLLEGLSKKILVPHSAGQGEILMARERFLVLCAGRRWGKESWVEEKLLTPNGWTRYGDVKVGDQAIGANGKATEVTGVFPQGEKEGYNVTFSDGVSVVAGLEHLWEVYDRKNRTTVKTTQELLENYITERSDGKEERRYAVPLVEPVHYDADPHLPLKPWTLGALLGDGCLSAAPGFATVDPEMGARLAEEAPEGASVSEFRPPAMFGLRGYLPALRELALEGKRSWEKFVPQQYLTASPESRLELLRGLLDTDGGVDRGRAEFTSVSEQLALDVVDLVRGLGGIATLRTKQGRLNGVDHRLAYVVRIRMKQCPFWLKRKADAWRPARTTRKIVSIAPVGKREMLCIEVADARALYVTTGYVLTHNTKVGAARALREARKNPGAVVWWVAPIYRNVKRGYQEVLAQLPDGSLRHAAPPENAFDSGRAVILRFMNGSRMEFYSADRPEGMLGGSSDFVVLDEAATMNESVWFQTIQPTLADRRGGALLISTPRGKNWFYRLWAHGQDELQTDFRSWCFPSFTNPTIPKAEWDRQKEILPAAIYEQEILADFVSASANVFRYNDDAIKPMEDPQGHVVLGIDLAKYNDFTVLIGVNAGNRRICYHERFNSVSWPEQRRRIHKALEDIEQTATSTTVLVDSTGLGDVVYDDLAEEGLDAIPIVFTASWKQRAVQLLAADLERGNAFICPEQVREFESYTYVISETTGRWKFEAGTGHDDEVSAALLAHWGVVNMGVPDVKMISMGAGGGATSIEDGGEGEIVEGQVVFEAIEEPTPGQLLNNPDAWI